jgi:Uma2 family endonuclease
VAREKKFMIDSHRKYTIDEYWRLVEEFPENKYEYIDGDIRLMTGGSPAHSQITGNIITMLNNALHSQECNVYTLDGALQLTANRLYYPDVSVSCDPADWTRTKTIESPSVVVEVLSPSNERIDRGEKLSAYQRYPTIQDILLVDSRRCLTEHFYSIGLHYLATPHLHK